MQSTHDSGSALDLQASLYAREAVEKSNFVPGLFHRKKDLDNIQMADILAREAANGRPVYYGSVSPAVKRKRRAKNKMARKTRAQQRRR